MRTKWKCPKHGVALCTITDYPGALICPAGAKACPDIFTEIDGRLYRSIGSGRWEDVKNGEIKDLSSTK